MFSDIYCSRRQLVVAKPNHSLEVEKTSGIPFTENGLNIAEKSRGQLVVSDFAYIGERRHVPERG
jgi:hypothetical protein